MVSAFFSLTLITLGLPYWLVVPFGLLFGAGLGLFVERAGVRLALEQKSEGWILLTIILGLFLFSVPRTSGGGTTAPSPPRFSSTPIQVLGVDVTPVEALRGDRRLRDHGCDRGVQRQTLLGKAFEAVSPTATRAS